MSNESGAVKKLPEMAEIGVTEDQVASYLAANPKFFLNRQEPASRIPVWLIAKPPPSLGRVWSADASVVYIWVSASEFVALKIIILLRKFLMVQMYGHYFH